MLVPLGLNHLGMIPVTTSELADRSRVLLQCIILVVLSSDEYPSVTCILFSHNTCEEEILWPTLFGI